MRARKALLLTLSFVTILFLLSCGGGGGSPITPPPVVSNPAPQITGLSPASVMAGSSATSVTINGTGFMSSSTVQWGAATRTFNYVSASQLTLSCTDADFATGGIIQVKVTNPAPGGGSASSPFNVNNPQPAVTGINPTTAVAGQISLAVTVTGTGFVASSLVNVNGNARPTTFVSATQLQATLQSADISSAGSLQLTVVNGAPGGGTSSVTAATTMSVTNPVPVLQSFTPGTLYAGTGTSNVTLNGTGFLPTSIVYVNGAQRTATFLSATQLQIAVSSSDVAIAGSLQISVSNPSPGGGSSGTLQLAIVNPIPEISSLSPAYLPVGSNAFVLTVNGTGFLPVSTVTWNGSPKTVQYVSNQKLGVSITTADLSVGGVANVNVINPAPGGGVSQPATFEVVKVVISFASPSALYVGSPDMSLDIIGGGFEPGCIAKWNGTALATQQVTTTHIVATVPATLMAGLGTAQLTVVNTDNSSSDPFAVSVIANPIPVLNYVSPGSAPAGNASVSITVSGSGFTPASSVLWNGTPLQVTSYLGYGLTATVPASLLQKLGVANIKVTNPGPGGGGTSASLPFSTFLPIQVNDLVYSTWSKLLYASVPGTGGSLGNTIVAIDPVTGNVISSVFVGSEPNRLALSSDGKVLWVGLDGAGAVRKVDLTTMTASTQFTLGGGAGMYNPPYVVLDLAVRPGSSDTLAVSTNATVKLYDGGVMRANFINGAGYLAFDPSGSKLYAMSSSNGYGSGYALLNFDATGITSSTLLSSSYTNYALKYDNGRVYTSNGTVLAADTGALLATFYSGPNNIAYGPVAPDSALGKSFVLSGNYSSTGQIFAFDTNTFVSAGSIGVSGIDTANGNGSSLVRWGQNGLAFRTKSQIYILQSDVVKDMSATPANLSVALAAPASATTGSNLTYTATITNKGPNTADDVVVFGNLPNGATVVSATTAQGSCAAGAITRCNLGTMLNNASVQVQFTVKPNFAGTLTGSATVSATQPDADTTDNSATASVAVTGADYNPLPMISSISPQAVKAGSETLELTVNGNGFTAADTVAWNGSALPTTFVSGSTLSATIDSAKLAALGYAWISVTAPAPGGGTSASLPFSIFNLVNIDTNQIGYEPFRRTIYATIPSTASQITGNSIVSIDPVTGVVSTPVNIGSQPNQFAFSDDGNYMFVGLDGSKSISRFNLKTNVTDFNFPLGTNLYGDALTPRSIAVAPGNPNLLAVDTSSWTGIALFDIAGTTATKRTRLTGPYTGSNVFFGDSTHVYSYDVDTTGAEFFRWTVASDGLTQLDASTLNGMGGFNGKFSVSNGVLFGSGGGVANPKTTPPSMLGKLAASGPVAGDGYIGRAFFMGCASSSYCYSTDTLLGFDQATFRQTDSVFLHTSAVTNVIRWGSDGLAVQVPYQTYSYNGPGQLVILRGPIVLPQLGVSHAVATLSSLTPNAVSAGSGNVYITVVGSGFVPGAVAKWNNSDRTTYFVDAAHLSVAIPSSDLAAPGTGSITVLNPGASSASSAVSFTIQ